MRISDWSSDVCSSDLPILAAPLALSSMLTSPAHAQFGRIVYDPSNYAQNLLTAARTLQQINNQITSLQNEAQMLINQAKNLASLPYSSLQALQQNVQRTQQLLAQAQNIAFDVQKVDQIFQTQYRSEEHTSELQSLMRISYAVFCLKKKKLVGIAQHMTHHHNILQKPEQEGAVARPRLLDKTKI